MHVDIQVVLSGVVLRARHLESICVGVSSAHTQPRTSDAKPCPVSPRFRLMISAPTNFQHAAHMSADTAHKDPPCSNEENVENVPLQTAPVRKKKLTISAPLPNMAEVGRRGHRALKHCPSRPVNTPCIPTHAPAVFQQRCSIASCILPFNPCFSRCCTLPENVRRDSKGSGGEYGQTRAGC